MRGSLSAAAAWCLAFSSFTTALEARPRNVRFTRTSLQQGLSQSAVNCILQDRHGFMWFGTEDGLNRYDGYDFTIYKHDRQDPRSLANNFVWALIEDRNHVLWIGTDGGGLNRWNERDQSFTQFRNRPDDPTSLSGDRVRVVYEDSRGDLWIGTENGLNRFAPATSAFTRFNHDPSDRASLSDDRVRAIHEDRQGELWIGTYGGGLNRLDRATGSFRHVRQRASDPASLADDRVRSLHEDRQGALWVGTQGGLSRLDRATGGFRTYRADPANPARLANDRVWAIRSDAEGTMWVGTEGGLHAWDPATEGFARYRHDPRDPESLGDDRVLSLHEDRGGVLWVGTKVGGLNRWNRSTASFEHFKQEPGAPSTLSSNVVTSFQEDEDGSLWVGTFGGGLNRLDRRRGTFRHYRSEPAGPGRLSDERVMSLLVDRAGTLWVGTFSSGLYRFDRAKGTFRNYRHDPKNPRSLGDNGIMFIREDRSGALWIGTYGGGLNRFDRDAGTAVRYRHDPALPASIGSDKVTAFVEDLDGILWIGTDGAGLNRFDPANGSFTRYRHDPADVKSLSSDIVWSIHEDRRGALWIGTQGGGLNRWDKADRTAGAGSFHVYTERQGLPNDFVYGILEDRRGYLWLSTNRGLSKLDPRTDSFKNYDTSHGLQSSEFNFGAYYRSPSGEMLFGGINGFNALRPEEVRDNRHVPPVVLTSFLKLNRPVRLDRPIWDVPEIELDYRDQVVSFEFAALDYSAPQRNRYAYRLEGFDPDWVDLGTVRRVTYTNLQPGRYLLRIRGSNNDGAWSPEGVSLAIQVVPPPWRSAWARSLYALVVVGALLVYVRAQRRKREREAEYTRKLEGEVRARTEELAQRNQELEIANRDLEDVSLTDSRTGLRNRRFVFSYIESDVASILREHEDCADGRGSGPPSDLLFMMIDLDEYRSINERYGQGVGDRLLAQVTEVLRMAFRASETLVRWGGDQFLVAGRISDRRHARLLAERVRRMLEQHHFEVGDLVVRTTCSIGFACFPFLAAVPAALSWEQVLAVADRGLYAAKRSGRNAWVGILTNDKTPKDALLRSILDDTEQLVTEGRIEVVASVPRIAPGIWSDAAPSARAG